MGCPPHASWVISGVHSQGLGRTGLSVPSTSARGSGGLGKGAKTNQEDAAQPALCDHFCVGQLGPHEDGVFQWGPPGLGCFSASKLMQSRAFG